MSENDAACVKEDSEGVTSDGRVTSDDRAGIDGDG